MMQTKTPMKSIAYEFKAVSQKLDRVLSSVSELDYGAKRKRSRDSIVAVGDGLSKKDRLAIAAKHDLDGTVLDLIEAAAGTIWPMTTTRFWMTGPALTSRYAATAKRNLPTTLRQTAAAI